LVQLLPAPAFFFTTRAEVLAERRRAHSADLAGLEIEERRAGHVPAALGLEAKRTDAVELRIVFAAVLADAADAVLIVQSPPKLVAHMGNALARLNVQNLSRRSSLEAGSTREKKSGRTGETKEIMCGSLVR
jgi:hypothetical protein